MNGDILTEAIRTTVWLAPLSHWPFTSVMVCVGMLSLHSVPTREEEKKTFQHDSGDLPWHALERNGIAGKKGSSVNNLVWVLQGHSLSNTIGNIASVYTTTKCCYARQESCDITTQVPLTRGILQSILSDPSKIVLYVTTRAIQYR